MSAEFNAGSVCFAQSQTLATIAAAKPSISNRRCQLEMPRSSISVRANESPRKCKFRVERISHQPSA